MLTTCKSICLFLLVLTAVSHAQPSTASAEKGKSALNLIFPDSGDTLDFPQVRFAGSIRRGKSIRVNGRPVHLFPSGAFVGLVDLQTGWNNLAFTAETADGLYLDTVKVYRKPPAAKIPVIPTVVDAKRIHPSGDVTLSADALLEVGFWGSPKGTASFSIQGSTKRFAMKEKPSRQTGGFRGFYHAEIEVPDHLPERTPLKITFHFRGYDLRAFDFDAPGKVTILPKHVILLGVTNDSANFILNKPDGAIELELPADLPLQLIVQSSNLNKVRLARDFGGFIRASSLRILPESLEHPYAVVGDISSFENNDGIILKMDITAKVPFQIRQSVASKYLEVSFFRAVRSRQWVFYPPKDETVKRVAMRQENGDVLKLRIYLNQKQQWGYGGQYVGNEFWLTIRKVPRLEDTLDKPLAGLNVAVDPGHGGDSMGGISATGLIEKNLNFDLAEKVRDLLTEGGAQVFMTRKADTTVSLSARVESARKHGAHIFLSLHHNSIGAHVDPLQPRGTSVYHTTSHSEQMARTIYKHLSGTELKPFGQLSGGFFVTRQPDFISCLVEAAFLTHPEDEMLLLQHDFAAKVAGAIVSGVVEFVKKQMPESMHFWAQKPATDATVPSSSQGMH